MLWLKIWKTKNVCTLILLHAAHYTNTALTFLTASIATKFVTKFVTK